MPALKRCHYETLGVERNATDEEIKKSFRKLALQQHPDKNPHRMEEAKEEFQILQQAYEVLSNPQERAWYDSHRIALIRGDDDGEFGEDIIDIMPFCSSSCYKGFGDDDEGFYTVYRKLFEKITAEEYEAGGGDDDTDDEIPNFGDSESGYDDVVGPFYAYWESYCTRQSFGWVDEYNTKHAGCRRVARLMDKENKKFRSQAKKMWNEKVRALVDFVKRKDKRYQAWKVEQERILKEKEEAARKKQEEEKASRLQERKKLFEQLKSAKANHLAENHDQLKQLEEWMADEFDDGDGEILDDEEEEEEYLDEYCVPCAKSFRTKKALINHEKSKKHLIQLEKWAAETNISSEDSENDLDEVEDESEQEHENGDAELAAESEDEIVIDKSDLSNEAPQPHSNGDLNTNSTVKNESNEDKSDEDDDEGIQDLSSRFVKNMKFKVESFDDNISKTDPKSNKNKSSKKKGTKSKKQAQLKDLSDDEDSHVNNSTTTTTSIPTISSQDKDKLAESDDDDFTTGSNRKKSAKEKKRRRANKSSTVQSAPPETNNTNNANVKNKGSVKANSENQNVTNGKADTNTDTDTITNADEKQDLNPDDNSTILITGSGSSSVEKNSKEPSEKSSKKPATSSDLQYKCGKCNEQFDSRSKLFKHLEKNKGHALPIGATHFSDEEKQTRGNKKGKAKRK